MSTRKYVTPALLCKPVAMCVCRHHVWTQCSTAGNVQHANHCCALPVYVIGYVVSVVPNQALFVASNLLVAQLVSVPNKPYLSTVKLMSVPQMLYSSSRLVCSSSDSIISSTVDCSWHKEIGRRRGQGEISKGAAGQLATASPQTRCTIQ